MTALAIFARAPSERVKTRLQLPAEQASALYGAMLSDVVDKTRTYEHASLWYASTMGPDFGLPTHRQRGDDLGARMRFTISTLLATHESVLIVGTDAPTLPRRCIDAALRAVEEHDLVLGPSADGGYYLIGARRTPSFDDVQWSSTTTLRDTVAANDRAFLLEPWYDVDRPDDLRLLATHLRLDPTAAPATSAALDSIW